MPPKIVFFQVKSNQDKLIKLIETAQTHFEKEQNLTILVPDVKVQIYIDELLWKAPIHSFLPHTANDENSLIQIQIYKPNISLQKSIFNLCPDEIIPIAPFRIIYELEDFTSSFKQCASQKRFKAYQEKNFVIESRS